MSETVLLLIYVLVILALPFGIAFALHFFFNKRGTNQETEFSETSKSYGSAKRNNNTGRSNKYKKTSGRTYEYTSKRTYKTWEEEKKNVFKKKAGAYISVDFSLYKATLSVIALFSWVIRKDGSIGDREMRVARSYFENHPIYNDILFYSPKDKGNDPISNSTRPYMEDCMDLLDYYNRSSMLLRYSMCCQYIKEADIHYTAALDLVKVLCQVAFSSDGVIDSEAEILCGIAKELNIRHEDWLNLMWVYGICKDTNQKGGDESSKRNNSRWDENAHNQERERSDEQQRNQTDEKKQRKSSTFGYKLTQAYNQLGLLTTATNPEIKAAFRLLAKKYHPDRLPSDATDMDRKISADQFRQIMEAYDLIRLEKGM